MTHADIPSALALLSHLDTEELKEIVNDETKFDIILKDIKQVGNSEKEMIIASNRSLAEYNLSLKPDIESTKEEILELTQKAESFSTKLKEKLEEYKKKSAGFSPDSTLAVLQTAAAQSEEETENIAQDFLNGDMDVDQFLQKFTPERIKMHLRKVKAEKMADLLRNGNRINGAYNGQSNLPYPSMPSYPSAGAGYPSAAPSVPYPLGPVSMPMPGIYGNNF